MSKKRRRQFSTLYIFNKIWNVYFHVKERGIQDNIIATFGTVHTIRLRKSTTTPKMVLKWDRSKVYNRVEWEFFKEIMLKLGFTVEWWHLLGATSPWCLS